MRLVLLSALIPLVSGCGLLGGLSTTRLTSPASLTVTSPVFAGDLRLPALYTCHGTGLSPPLQWSGTTTQTAKSFAIVVDDSQAPITPYVYWIVFDISPTTVAVGQSRLPTGARQGLNSANKASYDPPCPVGAPHQYRFTVYALNSVINLPNGTGLRTVWSAIARHVIAAGRLTARAYP
jgi:Raf kinase inhibitor-like YbhB/YbcL family protein